MRSSFKARSAGGGSIWPSPVAGIRLRATPARLKRCYSTSNDTSVGVAQAAVLNPTEMAAAVEPSLAAAVWVMPHTPLKIHMIFGTPASSTEIVPLQLEDLRPSNMTKPALLEFLQSNLTTKAARQKTVQCMVLSSSAYLPSQLNTISSLAAGIGIATSFCASTDSVHVLLMPALASLTDTEFRQRVSSITQTTCELLLPTFGKVRPLPEERLAAARAAEQTLNRQLRLWHPPTWAETLQQQLMSNRAPHSMLAVRSLMGPPSLAAARKLVEKQGLRMWELRVTPAAAAAQAQAVGNTMDDSPSNGWWPPAVSSRRRPSARVAAAAAAAGAGAATGSAGPGSAAAGKAEVVLVITQFWRATTEEEAVQLLDETNVYTDAVLA